MGSELMLVVPDSIQRRAHQNGRLGGTRTRIIQLCAICLEGSAITNPFLETQANNQDDKKPTPDSCA